MEKKERELMQKLVNKIGKIDPERVEYEVERGHNATGGAYYRLKFRQGEFQVELEAFSHYKDRNNPDSYRLTVTHEKSIYNRYKLWDHKFKARGAIRFDSEYNKLDRLEKAIVDSYRRFHQTVHERQTQKAKQERNATLNELEQALK